METITVVPFTGTVVETALTMHFFLIALLCTLSLGDTRLNVLNNATLNAPNSLISNHTRYVILDNDWSPTGFIPFLLALGAGMDVLRLVSDTANT